ncbi:MAG: HAMP domain-containing protein [Candidatus Omnitrophota bacterium]|nr:HAMP domain-containing protein [Candidatus Omnitrophota bacterium]
MRFSHKISLGISLLVVGLLALIMIVGNMAITRGIKKNIHRDLLAAQQSFQQFEQHRFRQLLIHNETMVGIPHLKAVVSTEGMEPRMVHNFAEEIRRTIDSDIVILTDVKGTLLASVSEPNRYGEDMSQDPAVKMPLEGKMYQGLWTSAGQIYQVVGNPFRFGPEVAGVLLTGFAVDREVMDTIAGMTGCDVAIVTSDLIQVSEGSGNTLTALRPELMQIGKESPGRIFTKTINNETYLLILGPFGANETFYALARSLDHELLFYRKLQQQILLMASGILIIALVLGVLYARRIARPIQALVSGSQKIADGDLSARVYVKSKGELGDLAQAFNTMAESLKKTVVSKTYIDNILRSMPNSVIVVTRQGNIETVNDATCALLGYAKEELFGKPASLFLGEDQALLFGLGLAPGPGKDHSPSGTEATYWGKGA